MNTSNHKLPFFLECLGWLSLIGLVVLPLIYYAQLPEQIPSHFNAKGKADAYSGKASIFIIPVIGVAIFCLLHFLSRSKSLRVNTTKKLSPEQKILILNITRKLLNTLKVIISLAFLYITYATIQTALGNASGLGNYFLLIFLGATFGAIGYFMIKANQAHSNESSLPSREK